MYKLLINDVAPDLSLLESLRKTNNSLQTQLDALQSTLQESENESTLRKCAGITTELAEAKRKLAKYEELCGGGPDTDRAQLMELLTKRSDELKRCQLSLESKEQVGGITS